MLQVGFPVVCLLDEKVLTAHEAGREGGLFDFFIGYFAGEGGTM